MAEHIETSVADITGALHSKFGPASKSYFQAKRIVGARHQQGTLNENSIWEYARSQKFEETAIGLSLLCSLPVEVVERVLLDAHREMTLMLAKALDFSWETTMSLLFLSAKDHRNPCGRPGSAERRFHPSQRRDVQERSQFYQSRKSAAAANSKSRRLPQLHAQ